MAGVTRLPFPPQLNLRGNLVVSWKRFRCVWESYETATALAAKEKPVRVSILLTCLGPGAIELFDGFTFAANADKGDPAKILGKFENYCSVEGHSIATAGQEYAQENDLIEECQNIFKGEGLLDGELHLVVVGKGVAPVKLPVHRMPRSVQLKVKAEIQRLGNVGIIRTGDTPTDWISSMVVVPEASDKLDYV